MSGSEILIWLGAHPTVIAGGVAGLSLLGLAVGGLLDAVAEWPVSPARRQQTETEETPAALVEPTAEPEPSPAAEPEPSPAAEPEPSSAAEPEPSSAAEPEPSPAAEPEPSPVAEPEPSPVAEPAGAPLRERLARTSGVLVGRLGGLLGGRRVDDALLEELEALLFTADLGVKTAESLLESVRSRARGQDAEAVRGVLRDEIAAKLAAVDPSGNPLAIANSPHVILVLGVNGSGKTTTIGKLAARYRRSGKSVLLGAGDTFRAAALEQLEVWGERVGCEVIGGRPGGDPAAVAFETVKSAIERKCDVAIIDTAGRLQTRKPLMEELGKIHRIVSRDLPGAPHEALLVLDSNTGQNAISQAELFTEVANVTGLVLTKLDGTAKGGVIVGLADRFGIPVKYVGVGEGIEDLRDFDAGEFVDALFAGGGA